MLLSSLEPVVKNILALVEGKEAREEYPRQPAGIHLSLGLVSFSLSFLLWVPSRAV